MEIRGLTFHAAATLSASGGGAVIDGVGRRSAAPRSPYASLLCGLGVVAAFAHGVSAEVQCGEAEVEALRVVDAYMESFNSRDGAAHAATLHYPSFRINAAGDLAVLQSAAEYAATFDAVRDDFPWDRTLYDSREVVQSGPQKVHVVVSFTRYRADGEKVSSHDSLYIASCREGRWGILARSSFVPVMRAP